MVRKVTAHLQHNFFKWLSLMGHAFNPSTSEAEAGGSLRAQSCLVFLEKFLPSQGYSVRPCLQRQLKGKRRKKVIFVNISNCNPHVLKHRISYLAIKVA